MTLAPPNAQFKHIGIYVRDLEPMLRFYTEIMGLVVTDSGPTQAGGKIVFMSASETEHHQFVLVTGRTEAMGHGLINQLSFRLESLGDVRRFYQIFKQEGIRIDRAMNHGNSWSIYAFDPEGNRLELYAGSPWYIAQPCAEPLDLDESEEAIMAQTEELVRDDPTYATGEAWRNQQAEAIKTGRSKPV